MGIVLLHFGLVTGVWVVPSGWVLTQSLSVFFVLSGFILAYRYEELRGTGSIGRYLAARVARIWPLHLAALLVVVLLSPLPFQQEAGAGTLLLNAFLLHAWVPVYSVYASFNAPSFSLSIELFLYLCFPLLVRGRAWTWVLKLAVPLALAGGMIALAEGFGRLPAGVDAAGLVYNHPLSRLWEFSVGVGAARLWRAYGDRAPPGRWTATAAEALLAGTVLANVAFGHRAAGALGDAAGLGEGARMWLANAGLTALPIAGLLVVLATGSGLLARAMAVRPAVLLGEISYSTYLLHGIVLLPIVFRWDAFRRLGDVHLTAVFVTAVLVVSYLSWALVEVPGRALVLRLSDRIGRRRGEGQPQRVRLDAAAGLRPAALGACGLALAALAVSVALTAPDEPSLDGLRALEGRAAAGWDGGGTFNVAPGAGSVRVSGWAIDERGRGVVRGVLVTVSAQRSSWLRAGLERRDVVRRLDDPALRFSGFAGRLDVDGMRPGSYSVRAAAVLVSPQGYVELPPARLVVR